MLKVTAQTATTRLQQVSYDLSSSTFGSLTGGKTASRTATVQVYLIY